MTGQKNPTAVKATIPPEQVERMREFLEWNRACAAQAEERGQTDTCYHTDIVRIEAALYAAGIPLEVTEDD